MRTITECRVCGSKFETIINLGELYVSDFPLPTESNGVKAPLELVLCNWCRLLQLKHTVTAESMYRNYWYRSGINQTMRTALADITQKAEKLIHLQPQDYVLDIGCNDGTLLASYQTPNIIRVGFDPAQNLAIYSREVADEVVVDFFTAKKYLNNPELGEHHKPKIITSIAMFYDLDDPNTFVNDINSVMHEDGLWIIQMSYLPDMLRTNELGNICAEHLLFYSLASLEFLLNRHNMQVVDVETNDINGGSFRIYIRKAMANPLVFGDTMYRALADKRVIKMREEEFKLGLIDKEPYEDFAWWIDRIKNDIVQKVKEINERGQKIFVYGASTKGNTLLQYYGLDSTMIPYAVERNPDKHGRVTVGSRIPIISEKEARAMKPDYMLVLPWHFIEEFKKREKGYLKSGGRFIMPAPNFAII